MSTKKFKLSGAFIALTCAIAFVLVAISRAQAASSLALLPTLQSNTQALAGDHPFPWPRALECPFSWQGIRGRYRVVAVESPYSNHLIVLDVRPSRRQSGVEFVQITEYTPMGVLFAEGNVYTPAGSRSVQGMLRLQSGDNEYMIGMRAYRHHRRETCQSNDLVLSISFCPVSSGSSYGNGAYGSCLDNGPEYLLMPAD